MRINVRTRSDVAVLSTIITGISVFVPLAVVSIVLWNTPLHFKLPILTIAGLIPLGIALPVSLIALSIIRQLFLKLEGGSAAPAA